jgi:hypothetical protein
MESHDHRPSPGDLASELGGLNTGLGILTMTFFPLALPALLLGLLLLLPALPLLALAGVIYLIRRAARSLPRRTTRAPALPAAGEAPLSAGRRSRSATRSPSWSSTSPRS